MACFKKTHRLLSASEFSHVMKTPDSVYRSPIAILLCKKNKQNNPRLGMAIGKKNIRKAVKRHEFKRIIRESFRLEQSCLGNFDFVVVARRDASEQSKAELRKKMDKLWQKHQRNNPC